MLEAQQLEQVQKYSESCHWTRGLVELCRTANHYYSIDSSMNYRLDDSRLGLSQEKMHSDGGEQPQQRCNSAPESAVIQHIQGTEDVQSWAVPIARFT
jgi:hypothetical protein